MRLGAALAAVGLALVAGCTSSGPKGPTSSASHPSGPKVAVAPLPGLTAAALLPRMKTLLGSDATVEKSAVGAPSGQTDYLVDTPRMLAGPGAFTVAVSAKDDAVVYTVLCEGHRATLGQVSAPVGLCADLTFPGVDNARLRTWITQQTSLPAPAVLQLGEVRYSLSYDSDKTMSLALQAANGQS